jgi:hypothetical protein
VQKVEILVEESARRHFGVCYVCTAGNKSMANQPIK